ncbi:hypothetical protein [Desertivirga xinjiangensis]|uniref:hypothetical protein n=1 Tax=Desertivirga xinjiangensis TaxID=539206 RepID=UPI00210C704B|nr:hypothetical protein [Pedobacter xinjiangensis]
MNNSLIFLFTALLFASACANKNRNNAEAVRLKHEKYQIDSLLSDSSLVLYVKTPGKSELTQVKRGERYPKQIEASYNVLKNKDGKVVYIAELPFSPKDDWFIAYRHYFDENGRLFAFQRQNNFFKSECTRGAALENLTLFYDTNFRMLDSVYTLTDSNKKKLEPGSCKFPFNFPYTVPRSLDDYQKMKKTKSF